MIVNDGFNPPRIINSRWTRTQNDTFKIINREQINQSNIYREEYLDRETRLFRNVDGVTKIDLDNVYYYGKLKAGNYIVYMKYMDDDYNETDIVAQTGVISIFNGSITDPMTISGGLMDEETDKAIALKISDIDTSFTYFKLYVYRTSCDSNGIKLDYAYKINTNYEITNETEFVYLNGFEESVDISVEELNIQYNIVDSVQTQAQVQNMLFFGNVTKPKDKDVDLQDLSLYINAEQYIDKENSIGFIDPESYHSKKDDDAFQTEYYSPINIYYKLGYWPDEIYRFGIVYVYNDDHLSPVYNLRGCRFGEGMECNIKKEGDKYPIEDYLNKTNKIPASQEWISNAGSYLNTKGVFKFGSKFDEVMDFDKKGIFPLGIKFSIDSRLVEKLREKNVKGFFFVRQNRIPTILCQGFSIGVDKASYIPMLKYENDYIAESFVDDNKMLVTSASDRVLKTNKKQSSGLLCVDAYLNKRLQTMFDTSEFKVDSVFKFGQDYDADGNNGVTGVKKDSKWRRFWINTDKTNYNKLARYIANLIYIDPEVPQKIFNDFGFSTKAGMQEDLKYSAFFAKENKEDSDAEMIRGIFTSFIGTTSQLSDNSLYNIRIKNYDESLMKEYFEIRMNDNSPFYCISNRYCISPKKNTSDYKLFGEKDEESIIELPTVYRGDCFTNTVTTRMHRNFTSSSVPINDTIIDPNSWKDNFKGLRNTTDWNKINKADVDAVPIGSWFTYKCFSNFNLGLRCKDPFQIEEQSIMGNPRNFYPIQDVSTKSSNKIPESNLMNDGYNSLLGVKRNFTFDIVPYVKDIFDTRIMFSNIQVDGAFKNSYKVFQGLSYEDIDRQYGSIIKILP